MPLATDKLNAVKIVVSHASCADGLASAIFCKNALPHVEVRFIQYDTPEHLELEPEPGMLFCDFSPHPSRYKEFIEAGALILDHHKTAQPIVEAFGENGVFGDELFQPGVCGAVLAFHEVWLPLQDNRYECSLARELAYLTGIRDTWQRQSPDWKKACILSETLRFFPEEGWLTIAGSKPIFSREFCDWWDYRRAVGQILVERLERDVEKAVEGAHRFTTPFGTRVVLFPGARYSSDAAEALHDEADLVVGFEYIGVDSNELATLSFSTRSHTDFNCGQFCKSKGGGGHTQAAGFAVKFEPGKTFYDPYSEFQRLLSEYEQALKG